MTIICLPKLSLAIETRRPRPCGRGRLAAAARLTLDCVKFDKTQSEHDESAFPQ